MTAYRLLIAIEHALPHWPLVDFRKYSFLSITPVGILARELEISKRPSP
jgi:hypothetical protein